MPNLDKPTLVVLLGAFLIIIPVCSTANDDSLAVQGFELKRQNRVERIQDFYVRLNQIERQDMQRRQGEDEKRRERKRLQDEYEKTRREYILQRKQRPVEDPTAFERELKQRILEHERARQEFVKTRDKMLNVLRQVGDIPPEDELELDMSTEL